MGFFKWLGNYARKYNDQYERQQEAINRAYDNAQEAEERYKDSLECCANCLWFNRYDGQSYHCVKHDFCFDIKDVDYHDITHKKTCDNFHRK